MPAQSPEATMSELMDQAVETFGGAMRAGVRFQEDVVNWWNDALSQIGSVHEWQRRSNAVLSDAIPTAQKSAEEAMKVMDQNYRNSMDLLKMAFESPKSETSTLEAAARAHDLWEASVATMRTNARAMAQANVRAMESWAEFLRRSLDIERPRPASKK